MPTPAGAFVSFAHRRFALAWTGIALSAVGTWMQIIAQSLLTLSLTHGSGLALGLVSLSQASSFFLFALLGGGIADSFDKRRLLLITQTMLASLAALLGWLTASGRIELWMILVVAFLSGTILSADQPARAALLPSLVPPELRTNAISLQATAFQGASIAGPALAGLATAAIGYSGDFFLNAASYLAVLAALLLIGPSASPAPARRQPLLTAVAELLDTVRRDPVLRSALAGFGALLFFAPSLALLLPILTTTIWRRDAAQLGLLFSCAGLGAIAAALLLAAAGDRWARGAPFLASLLLAALTLAAVPLAQPLWLAAPLLFLFGAAQSAAGTITTALLQSRVPAPLRGRVMSLNTLIVMGIRPLGDFPAGALISLAGPAATALASAALITLCFASLLTSSRALRSA